MGKGRLEAFSDGVLAVAITLLAFNLHAGVRSKVPLATQIREQWPSFAAYVLSFFIIGVIWLNHHYLLTLTNTVDRRLMLYNLLLLLFVAAIPYATATYADYVLLSGKDAHTAVLVYTFIMEGMAISRFLICYHNLFRRPESLAGTGAGSTAALSALRPCNRGIPGHRYRRHRDRRTSGPGAQRPASPVLPRARPAADRDRPEDVTTHRYR
jgi:uncharacterized membrane protein